MKQKDTSSLRKSVTFTIAITMFILIVIIVTATDVINQYAHEEHEQKRILQVQKSIEQNINHYMNTYKYTATRIIKTTPLAELLIKKDRKRAYKLLEPKWKLLYDEEASLRIIHLHLKDGSSFLRMHMPEKFGDNLIEHRPMIREIHRSHQTICAYETGKLGSLYRIIMPIHDVNQTYVGALELGLDIRFIIRELYKINNVKGLIFIKDDNLTFFNNQNNLIIDGYKLQSEPTGELKVISNALTALNFHEDDVVISAGDKKYNIHVFTLDDFQNQPKIKIIIFHDLQEGWSLEGLLLAMQSALILISLALLTWFIYRRIGNYEESVSNRYKEQIIQIKDNENKFHSIFNNSNEGMLLADVQTKKFLTGNKAICQMLGYKLQEIEVMDFMKIHPSESIPYITEQFEKQRKGEITIAKDIPIKRKDGSIFFADINSSMITLSGKKYLVGIFRDVTEQKKLQSKLKEKDDIMLAQSRQAAMGDMIGMIAHQWRQPITAIGMGAQNMQLDIELEEIDPKRFDEKLSKIVEQTHFLSNTIDDFRDFLKPNKKPGTHMLSEILEGALNIIAKSLENNNIKLKKSFKNDIEITTFRNEVIQVLINIINNAKDIIKIKEIEDGLITIEVDADKHNAYIKICDNAGGIPQDVLPKIFEPYFTTKDEKGGTGLGLYMSQMIIEKHLKGKIMVENINGGACFTVLLPRNINYGE